jgi:hypothetical protein
MHPSVRKKIILVKTPSGEFEAWTDLKSSCRAHGWVYCTLSKKPLPIITKDGCIIYRINAL